MVIHATKCDKKSVDPQIGDTPPLGYDCLRLIEKKTMPLPLNHASQAPLRPLLDAAIEHTLAIFPGVEQIVGAVETKVRTKAVHQRAAARTDTDGRREVGQF